MILLYLTPLQEIKPEKEWETVRRDERFLWLIYGNVALSTHTHIHRHTDTHITDVPH